MSRIKFSSKSGFAEYIPKNLGGLYSLYKKIYDNVLINDHLSMRDDVFKSYFVENKSVGESLVSLLSPGVGNKLQLIVGPKGSGKSTFIRSYIGYSQIPTFYENEGTLFVPFFLRFPLLRDEDVRVVVASGLRGACELLISKFLAGNIDYVSIIRFVGSNSNIINYDSSLTPYKIDLFAREKTTGLSHAEYIFSKLDKGDTQITFQCLFLKYLYSRIGEFHGDIFRHLLIVLDDIESQPMSVQRLLSAEIAAVMGEFSPALQEYSVVDGVRVFKHLSTSVVISCRPITYDNMRENKDLDTFSSSPLVMIDNELGLSKLLTVRFGIAKGEVVTSQDRLSVECIRDIAADMVHHTEKKDLLVHLCNYDFRESIKCCLVLTQNSRWIESRRDRVDGYIPPAVKSNYRVTGAGMIRALGCLKYDNYSSDRETPIANILGNWPEKTYDLIFIYCLRYMWQMSRNVFVSKLFFSDLREALSMVYSHSDLSAVFHWAMNRLIQWDLIRKVNIRPGILSSEELSDRFVPMPKFFSLWMLASQYSVQLELYAEDTYINLSYLEGTALAGGRYSPVQRMVEEDRFLISLAMLDAIVDAEKAIVDKIYEKNKIDSYNNTFGHVSIGAHFLNGIEMSLRRVYTANELNIPRSISARVEAISYKISNINVFLDLKSTGLPTM